MAAKKVRGLLLSLVLILFVAFLQLIQVSDACEGGYYGPDCNKSCNCLNAAPCEDQMGKCPQQKCASGYSVRGQQVHCQECDRGTFGVDCLEQCHCNPESCHTNSGECDGSCFDNWVEPTCQSGISGLDAVRVNPLQRSNFTCHFILVDVHQNDTTFFFYRFIHNAYNDTGIQTASISVSGSQYDVVYDVETVHSGEYVCGLGFANRAFASFFSDYHPYRLPVIGEAPLILNTTSTTVHLQWNAWSQERDIGDPPLIGYDIFVMKDGGWMRDQRLDQHTSSVTVGNLNPDTLYAFRVAAVREGPGGAGPRSPPGNGTTLCGKPSSAPSMIEVTASNPKELEVSWQLLSPDSSYCRSGFTHYTIYYTPTGSSIPNSAMVTNKSTSYTLQGLDVYLDYTIQISVTNKDVESERSPKIVHRTHEEVPPAPINVSVTNSAQSSFTVSWSTPLPSNINGNIRKYVVSHQQIKPSRGDFVMGNVPSAAFQGEHTVANLPPASVFVIQVRTVNGAGASRWSESVNATTMQSGNDANVIYMRSFLLGLIFPFIVIFLF